MVGFTILASFMSVLIGHSLLVGTHLFWLSFPFSLIVEQISWTFVTGYHIQFLSFRMISINPQIGPFLAFSFFLGMNFVGVVLGLWIKESLKEKLFDFFIKSGAISLVCGYIIWIAYSLHLKELWLSNQIFHSKVYEQYLFESNFYLVYTLCIYYFWVPALIATAIYGLKRMKE
jgi:hypothetical protein